MLREIEIVLRCPPRSLLKPVQHVHRLRELRDGKHTVLCAGVNTDLLHSRSDAGFAGIPKPDHRLVGRVVIYKNLDEESTTAGIA